MQFAVEPEKVENVLRLDDSVVWGALSMIVDAQDDIVAEYAKRLRDRKLFKCIDVRERLVQRLGTDKEKAPAIDAACAAVRGHVEAWLADKKSERARIIIDQAVREPYKDFQESKGPLNQIRIRTGDKELADLGKLSKVVAAIEPFRLFRAYVDADDHEARRCVNDAVEVGVKNVSGA